MFSKSCEYAIKATIYIANQSKTQHRSVLKEIAVGINSPEAFTAKILQQLAKNQIINSIKGLNGGYELSENKSKETTLLDLVLAIDGAKIYEGCGLGLEKCGDHHPCPIHNEYKPVRTALINMLSNTSISKLTEGIDLGLYFLKS